MTTTSTPIRPDAEVSVGYWIIDRTHSRIGFRVRNWIVTTVTGAFVEYDGALDWRDEAERSTATLSLNAASIGTGVDTRDARLCSPHFFEVDRYPTITVSSTEIEPLGDGRDRFQGDLGGLSGLQTPAGRCAQRLGTFDSPPTPLPAN